MARKLTRRSDRELLAAIEAFTGTPDQLRRDSRIKDLAAPTTANPTRTVKRRRVR